jgi:hypothetical protein
MAKQQQTDRDRERQRPTAGAVEDPSVPAPSTFRIAGRAPWSFRPARLTRSPQRRVTLQTRRSAVIFGIAASSIRVP